MSPNEDNPPHGELRGALEKRILRVIDDVDKGFQRVMQMYMIAFYMGLGLILMAFLGSFYWKENLFLLLFGGVGLLDVVAFFVFRPAEDLQRSRGNLAQLVSAFLTWYNDTHNWNQVIVKELRKDNSDVGICREASQTNVLNTISLMTAIELFVASKANKDAGANLTAILEDLQKRRDVST